MGFQVGDSVFNASGVPGVVRERSTETGKLKVEITPEEVRQSHRHGYLNGLTPPLREEFTSILDELKGLESKEEQVAQLHEKVEEMKFDPHKRTLSRYLTGELAHLRATYGFEAQTYSIDEVKAR